MKTHALKVWSEFFDDVLFCRKKFEVRKNDRDFKVNDTLLLQDWDKNKNQYSGRETAFQVTYILYGGQFGIEPGYCVMSIKPIRPE
jgi:hypothetical protein